MKNSFLIMESWAKTLICAPTEQAGKLVQLLCRYNATGDDSCDDPMVSAVFAGWKAQIDANNEAYEAKVEGARKAREKKNNKTESELIAVDINDNQEVIKDDINGDNDNVYDNDKDNNIYYVGQTRPPIESDVDDIIEYLNKSTHKHFRLETEAYRKVIRARLKDGYTIDDFRKVIDSRVLLWGDSDRMSEYLRPQTLFTAAHFDSYLNEADKPKEKPPSTGGMQQDNKFQQYEQRTDYDFDALERMLTAN